MAGGLKLTTDTFQQSSLFKSYMKLRYVFLINLFVLRLAVINLLIMACDWGHLDRPARYFLSKRAIALVIPCLILFVIWFNTAGEGQLRNDDSHVSKQAEKSAALATSAVVTGDQYPDVGAQLHNLTTFSTGISSPAPFPALPSPDNEEYMAICMAGQFL